MNYSIALGKCTDNGNSESFVVVYPTANPDFWPGGSNLTNVVAIGCQATLHDAMSEAITEFRVRRIITAHTKTAENGGLRNGR